MVFIRRVEKLLYLTLLILFLRFIDFVLQFSIMHNEAAVTYVWLKHKLGFNADDFSVLVSNAWANLRQQMLSTNQTIHYTQNWISDFWLARSSETVIAPALSPKWDPPEQIDEWPGLGVENLLRNSSHLFYSTNNEKLQTLLTATLLPPQPNSQDAVDQFTTLQASIAYHADSKMVRIEHVRAWIGTSIGHLLMGVALSPQHQAEELVRITTERLLLPQKNGRDAALPEQFQERSLEFLYNKRMSTPDRVVFSDIKIRVGQGEEWREHWDWLSTDLSAPEMIRSVRLAALLLRCPPLINGLINALQSEDKYLNNMALAVIRRLLLTLKVMAWLDLALSQPWTHVRPQDLACFAFNAVKPDWPRRVVGISHRSKDVKPTLVHTYLWTSGRCAIDANYAPAWETNTGMMWGLFAATPFISRIFSPGYLQSVWCFREYEIIEYLINNADFLSKRSVFDLDTSQLNILDEMVLKEIDYDNPPTELRKTLIGFPPMCNVWTPTALPEWEVKMLRASAALRIMCIDIGNPSVTNEVALLLTEGVQISVPAPTNNPDSWRAYAAFFSDLQALCNTGKRELALKLPEDYPPEEMMLDLELSQRIPDLSSGIVKLNDILVAYEWLRTEWRLIVEQKYGDLLAINCRRLTKELWQEHEQLSLLRGLAAMRLSVPLWFIQSAGQEVETWPLVGTRPIFTEHVNNQFSWMFEMTLDRSVMESRYPVDSGLAFSDELIAVCKS